MARRSGGFGRQKSILNTHSRNRGVTEYSLKAKQKEDEEAFLEDERTFLPDNPRYQGKTRLAVQTVEKCGRFWKHDRTTLTKAKNHIEMKDGGCPRCKKIVFPEDESGSASQ